MRTAPAKVQSYGPAGPAVPISTAPTYEDAAPILTIQDGSRGHHDHQFPVAVR